MNNNESAKGEIVMYQPEKGEIVMYQPDETIR